MTTIRPDLRTSAAAVLAVVLFAAVLAVVDPSLASILVFVFALAFTWWTWPGRVGNHTPHREAPSAADNVVIYWRPG